MSRVIRLSTEVHAALERLRKERGLRTQGAVLRDILHARKARRKRIPHIP